MNDLRDFAWQASSAGGAGGGAGAAQSAANGGAAHGSGHIVSRQQQQQTKQPLASVSMQSILAGRQNNPFSTTTQLPSRSSTPGSVAMAASRSTNGDAGKAAAGGGAGAGAGADSFGGLVDFGKPKAGPMSLQAKQAAMEAQRNAGGAALDQHFGGLSFQPPAPMSTSSYTSGQPQQPRTVKHEESESADDLIAQINGERPFHRGDSFFPPPPESPTRSDARTLPGSGAAVSGGADKGKGKDKGKSLDDDFMDMFAQARAQRDTQPAATDADDDDDILGALGQPVSARATGKQRVSSFGESDFDPRPAAPRGVGEPEQRRKQHTYNDSYDDDDEDDEDLKRAMAESLQMSQPAPVSRSREQAPQGDGGDNRRRADQKAVDEDDRAVAQVVDMGFTEMQARMALANTDNGRDVRAALELLLQIQGQPVDAPRRSPERPQRPRHDRPGPEHSSRTGAGTNAGANAGAGGQGDDWVDQTYSMASKTFASANTWFQNKSAMARRKLAEYNTPVPGQQIKDDRPRWMRETERQEMKAKGKSKAREEDDEGFGREEGLPMHPAERRRLEANGVLPSAASASSRRNSVDSSKSGKSALSFAEPIRQFVQGATGATAATRPAAGQAAALDARRFKADDEDASQFVSSRRRRPQDSSRQPAAPVVAPPIEEEDLYGGTSSGSRGGKGKGKSQVPVEEEDDLFGPSSSKGKGRADSRANVPPSPSVATPRATKPVRHVPHVDAGVVASSNAQRERGSAAFKRGDFATALVCYDRALSGVPESHPLRAVALANRALARIQTGSAKEALADSDAAIGIVGASRGEGETVDAGGAQPIALSPIWAKAMQRKAMALEMQERHGDALPVWRELVRSGLGGVAAVDARQRCEKALAPKPAKPPAASAPAASSGSSAAQESRAAAAAVKKLRQEAAVNAAEDAEKVALYDSVQAKLDGWSKGKEQNLRALLASMDAVLWPSANWKRVTLADLVVPAKCKVVYMKALAKVHPDKISRDASVEEKMIAAAVFAKLNGAWDAFKQQNNM